MDFDIDIGNDNEIFSSHGRERAYNKVKKTWHEHDQWKMKPPSLSVSSHSVLEK